MPVGPRAMKVETTRLVENQCVLGFRFGSDYAAGKKRIWMSGVVWVLATGSQQHSLTIIFIPM